uniref:Uncharacterized protein n=1 Tax=Oryza glumipatula TaxID=40148 RepID=A0A0E0B6V1_9ORYZ
MASSQETMSTGVDFFFFLAEQHLRYSLLRSRAYGKEKMLVDMQQHKKLVDITLLRLEFPSCPLDVGLAVLEVLADRHGGNGDDDDDGNEERALATAMQRKQLKLTALPPHNRQNKKQTTGISAAAAAGGDGNNKANKRIESLTKGTFGFACMSSGNFYKLICFSYSTKERKISVKSILHTPY